MDIAAWCDDMHAFSPNPWEDLSWFRVSVGDATITMEDAGAGET